LRRSIFVPLIVLTLLLAGCKSTYYKTMRTLGKEKRDILVQRIKDAKKDQDQTKKQLQTTMESFQALTGFQGGSLEKSYKRLNSDYESAASQGGKLHDKIQSIDQVSNDLFKEWQGEINAMDNGKLKVTGHRHAAQRKNPPDDVHARHASHRRPDRAGVEGISRSGPVSETQP
jgi:Protein of unknown function (DUF2959)